MNDCFITKIEIRKVRHLHDLTIRLDDKERKNLIITGKNGSGKTSLLESIKNSINAILRETESLHRIKKYAELYQRELEKQKNLPDEHLDKRENRELYLHWNKTLEELEGHVILSITNEALLQGKYKKGDFIFAYYSDERRFETEVVQNIEKVNLKDSYSVEEKPGTKLTKYLVDLKSTQAFAESAGKTERARQIREWFSKFENLLRTIFADEDLTLDFDIETYQFKIIEKNREPFDFNTLSSGYGAILEIVADLMMRMTKKNNYQVEGVAFIDEIETHLHLELQKAILPFLQEMFPNIQFIVTTHSPFILSSAKNVVIYDLEKHMEIQDGLSDLPYEGIVEGYFESDRLSKELRDKFEEYKRLAEKDKLDDDDFARIAVLEVYLDEIPDYLAIDITSEYSRLKLELQEKCK